MIKAVISIFLISTLSHAGMFDSIMGNIPSSTTKTVAPTATKSSGLLSSLTDSLGVTPTQASGGTAAIMQYAKSQTSTSDYSTLTSSVPGLDNIGSSSMLGALSGSINSASAVNSAFKALGMDASMVQQFIPVITKYIGGSGGTASESIITKALSALM